MTRLLLLLLLLSHGAPAFAGVTAAGLLRQVRRQFEARGLWEIHFEQRSSDATGADLGRVEGRLLACPDGAFRVDAGGLHLLCDGRDLWRWEDGAGQVLLEKPGQGEDVLLPHQLLMRLEDRFTATAARDQGPRRKALTLKPKAASEALRDITLILEQEGGAWWPERISFTDFADIRSTYLVKSRASWPDRGPRRAELTFSLPAGAELIDLRPRGERR